MSRSLFFIAQNIFKPPNSTTVWCYEKKELAIPPVCFNQEDSQLSKTPVQGNKTTLYKCIY